MSIQEILPIYDISFEYCQENQLYIYLYAVSVKVINSQHINTLKLFNGNAIFSTHN